MTTISYDTYQRLGEGIRYYNMNLGHRETDFEQLPSLNPFQGLAHEEVDLATIQTLEAKLEEVTTVFQTVGVEALADSCDVSVQNVEYAYSGVQTATSAITDAYAELC